MRRLALCGLLAVLMGCSASPSTSSVSVAESSADSGTAPSPGLFADITATSGIVHTYRNGEQADRHTILESLGGGAGWLDFDQDGLPDLLFPGGGEFDTAAAGPGGAPTIRGLPPTLVRNLGGHRFADVTASVGLAESPFYSHGVAVADFDRDGFPDVLLTGYRGIALYRNEANGQGGRRFRNVTAEAKLSANQGWSASAAWGDLDGDGWPDLVVAHYVDWSFANDPKCSYDGKLRDVCPPKSFNGLPDQVFRNRGDGTFDDVSATCGIRSVPPGKGLGVMLVDVTGDRHPDVLIANDTTDNLLFVNRSQPGSIRLEEVGISAGFARDARGVANGSMGLAVADLDANGLPSVMVTNYENESHGLYRHLGGESRPQYRFSTLAYGLAAIGQSYVGWGVSFADLEWQGREDLLLVHGHAIRFPLGTTKRAQLPIWFRPEIEPTGKIRRYGVVPPSEAGRFFQTPIQARALLVGDLTGTGRLDAVVTRLNAPVMLLRNQATFADRHWLGVELTDSSERDWVGSRVQVRANGVTQTRFVIGGGGFASSLDPRLHFGLGRSDRIDELRIEWSDGRTDRWQNLSADAWLRCVPGTEPQRLSPKS
ncbi:CRTAC1 family protein [Tuwongella immobilis]|uniref:ASPIC/UnbV domain-containing protein n=1 Tax=Tuwongella immobilis TaxID=692036 RepID=A0A6C2YKG6_9BACT|nr:CRTAC1 family protein [Tuwongella immobilis]VIP02068.1 Uncharacterized protein OS=Planctomyces maris DSM 8797 GN=PM8797T_22088 PE=4 SV=1: VCBS: UnbV_ASPIC [Tuwongella immobilis]VTS00291.1 Uncharacterized protein OS=Planctomyces maris DSM 8797 GN=PM8797T_22088 PE=4 SV=1: VCBS: UnbV_ASPIC [Tuwongella immobilis]